MDRARITSRVQSFPVELREQLLQPANWRQWSLYAPDTAFPGSRTASRSSAMQPIPRSLSSHKAESWLSKMRWFLANVLNTAAAAEVPAQLRAFERVRRPRTPA